MTALTNLRDEIAKHPPGSDVACILAWAEIELNERSNQICDLEYEIVQLIKNNLRRANALNELRGGLMAMSDYILKENFDMPLDTFAKDFAPFKNVMAHHGVEPYAKAKRKKAAKGLADEEIK